MKKKGFVWVSAVLYIALGVVAISLVLSAGLPLINKMKDRNTVIQTKDLMHTIDKNIWQVRSEGIGSKRFLQPIIIKGGKLMIFSNEKGGENKNKIIWEMNTKVKMMEACDPNKGADATCTQSEGNLKMYSYLTKVEDEYKIVLELDYTNNIDISLPEGGEYTSGSGLIGNYGLAIENSGAKTITLTLK